MSTAEIRDLGAIPQHELPGRGYFTVRNGRDVISVCAPQVDTALRREVLARLPGAASPLHVVDALPHQHERALSQAGSGKPQVGVTATERARIIAAAQQHTRRIDVCAAAFDGATSGPAYQKTKRVLDEEGLLLGINETAAQTVGAA